MDAIPDSIAQSVERRLAEYKIRPRGDLSQLTWSNPVPMALDVDGRIIEVAALYMPEMSAFAALKAANLVPLDVPLLVVGPRIHASSADTMRTRGIWYVDEAGNAYLHGHELLIDVRGRREPKSMGPRQHRKSGPANPFTPKRAQVVSVLLSKPALADAPLREIAETSGVSLGMAKDTMDALELIGYVEQLGSRRRLIRRGALLDLWASAYPAGLGRANRLAVVRGDVNRWSAPGGLNVAISGEQAVPGSIRNPESLVLYIDSHGEKQPLRDLMLTSRWHSDPHGNIIIRELFWRNLDSLSKIGTAPPALVYADLLASNESRQIEIAGEMRKNDERLVNL